jgi:hypothetical protein
MSADEPVAICQRLCTELAVEISKNVLEVPISSASLRNESATKSTVRAPYFAESFSFRECKRTGNLCAFHSWESS